MTSVVLRRARLAPQQPLRNVLISAGHITDVTALEGRTEVDEVVDLDGRLLLPGLWDRHVHFDQWAQVSSRLDLSRAATAAAAADLALAHVAEDDEGHDAPLVGYGFRDALWPDVPHRDLLDAVSGDLPVVLISGDLHSAWLNSAALRRFGHGDHATGLLREEAAMQVIGEAVRVADGVLDAWSRAAMQSAAARGVVGVVDMEKPWSLEAWRRRMTGGDRGLRVISSVWPERLDDAIAQHLHTGTVINGTGGLLTVGPLKVIIDGSLNTRTAYCLDGYASSTDDITGAGVLLVPPDELAQLMLRAMQAGFECAVHAIGDRANTVA